MAKRGKMQAAKVDDGGTATEVAEVESSGAVKPTAAQRAAFEAAVSASTDDGEGFWTKPEKKDAKEGKKGGRTADEAIEDAAAKTADVEDPDDSDPGDETDEEEGDGERDDSAPKSIEYRRARAALERDGRDREELDAMDDAALIEKGRKRVAHYSEHDRLLSKSKATKSGKDSVADVAAGMNVLDGATPTADVSPFYAKLDAKLQGGADSIGKELRELDDARIAPVLNRVERLEKALNAKFELDGQRMFQQTVARVKGQFPDLADEDTVRAVNEFVEHNWSRPKYADLSADDRLEQLMIDGSRAEGLREAKAPSQQDSEKAERLRQARRNGHPTTGARKQAPTSTRDRQRLAFDVAIKGGGADAARRAAGL